MDQLDFGLGQLDRLANYYPRVEGKASAIFAINAATLSIIALNYPFDGLKSAAAALGAISVLLIAFSIWNIYLAFFPDTKSGPTKSIVYFGDISKLSLQDYEKAFLTTTRESLVSDVICQIHRNSQILGKKYNYLKFSIILTCIGLAFGIAFLSSLTTSGASIKWAM